MRMDSDSESDEHKSVNNSSNKSSSSNSESDNSSSGDDDDSSHASSPASSPDKSRSGKKRLADIKEAWEENPDVYGIRRSSRDRKEPERLAPTKQEGHRDHMRRRSSSAVWGSSDSDDSDDGRHHHQQRPLQSRRPGGGGATSASAAAARRRQQTRSRPSRAAPRQLSASSESEESSDDDKASRAVSRRKTSRVNYREQDEAQTDEEDLLEPEEAAALAAAAAADDNADTIERVLNDRMGRRGATGAATTIYAVSENGDPNEGFDPKEDEALSERQYMLKWKGWSHLHNTWESEETLRTQNVKGIKKIDNYRKRTDEVNRWLRHANPEDVEYFNCQNELMQGLVSSYLLCDRVIAESPKPGHEYPDYLVKWQNLPYADCTWEDGNLVARRYELKIDQFVVREQSRQTPTKLNPVLRKRPKFTSIVRQPDYMCGTSGDLVLRDYQLDGVNWMVHSWCRDNSVILADEMGLGKTIQTTCFLYYLFKQHSLFGPFLVVVPLSTLPAWQRELALWGPEMNVVTYLGDVLSRERIRHYEWAFPGNKRLKFNVLLTSYEILLKDKSFLGAISWAALLVDEAHRLKNEESLLYKVLIEFNTNYRLLITGTPLQNSLKELWSLLHFIMPHRFDKWENFEVDMDQGSKAYARLHRLLEPFLLRRVKKDVEKSLPSKVEQILRVGMTTQQKQFYKWILTRNYTMLKRGLKSAAPSLINLVMELKKCCNHAHLIKPPDSDEQLSGRETLQGLLKNSGKLVLLDKLLVRLRERGHRVLIFSQMVRMLDILAEYLQLRLFPFQRLDGSIKGDVRRQALDHFNAEGSQDFCFLLSTRAGGLGINLATADTVIIYDSDWNPQNDLQAQARAHRIGQKNQVNIYRLVTMQSVEEDIIERAKRKMVLDHLVIQSMDSTGRTVLKKGGSSSTTPFNKDELNAILKFGAEELFSKDDVEEEEPTCDIDLILQRAETREDEPGSAPANDLLSAFKVASFHVDEDEVTDLQEVKKPQKPSSHSEDTKDWDDIIPSDMRAKIEEEARQQEMEDLYLPPRSRKTVQSQTVDDEAAVSSQRRKRRLEASSGEEESDSEAPKKRSSGATKERVKGFTDAEVRRFFKAFRRFGCPLERLEAIATEAELQEKSAADLRRLGETILSRCRECMRQHNSAKEPAAVVDAEENGHHPKDAGGKKKRERGGASFRLSGVAIYARPVLHSLEELEPLHRALPADPKQRRDWQLDTSLRVKPVHWDVEWSVEDDARLLRGVYEYGMGAWESIKIDPSIQLEDKILLKQVDSKPQAKQLQARIEYLLKVLKKSIKLSSDKILSSSSTATATTASSAGGAASSTPSKRQKRSATSSSGRANKKAVSKEIIENDDLSTDEEAATAPSQEVPASTETGAAVTAPAAGGGKKGAKKKGAGPMHYTASHEPVEVSVTEELPEAVFLECKEKMRPVKRSLKALDSPDPTLSDAEQVNHTRHCLIQIGTHIDHCLLQLHQPDKIREWRSNLWSFVSKFTEFDSRKLYKLYKHAMKKQGGPAESHPARSSPAPLKDPLKDPLAAADGHTTASATSHKEHRSGPEPRNNDKRAKKHDAKESRGSDKHSKNSSSALPGNDASRKSKDSKKDREEEHQPDPIRRTDGGYAGNNGHYGDKRPHADAGTDWSRKRERRGGSSGGNAEDRRGAVDGNGEERSRRGGGDSGWSDHRRSSSNSGQQRHNRDRSHEREYRPMDGGGGHHGHQHWGNSGGGYRQQQQQWHVGYNGPQQRGHPPHTPAAGSEWRRERSGGGEWRRGERSSDNYHYDRRGPPSSAPSGS